MLLAEFGTGQVFWSMLWFFLFFIWIWLLISLFGDIFRSKDLSGGAKALWTIFIIILPFLGVPLALGRRRSHRSYGFIIGLAALIAYNQVVRYGESVVDDGRTTALIGLWTPYLFFALASFWLYYRRAYTVPSQAGGARLDAAVDRLLALLPAKWRRSAGTA